MWSSGPQNYPLPYLQKSLLLFLSSCSFTHLLKGLNSVGRPRKIQPNQTNQPKKKTNKKTDPCLNLASTYVVKTIFRRLTWAAAPSPLWNPGISCLEGSLLLAELHILQAIWFSHSQRDLRPACSEEILGCEYQFQMLSSRTVTEFQKKHKDEILRLEISPPWIICIISLHTAPLRYWLAWIPFSLMLKHAGLVDCALKVGNPWGYSLFFVCLFFVFQTSNPK